MELTGIIRQIFDEKNITNHFNTREVIVTIEANTQYPQHISIIFVNDKINQLDKFRPGDNVQVEFRLRGREWNGPQGTKYYNTIDGQFIVHK